MEAPNLEAPSNTEDPSNQIRELKGRLTNMVTADAVLMQVLALSYTCTHTNTHRENA